VPVFEFTLVFGEGEILDPDRQNALFEAGFDDATFGEIDGVPFGDFSREADSMADAVKSVIEAVQTSLPDITLVRVEPDDLVTMADIAERLGRSRESVRLVISGARGPGGFPSPVSHLKARGRLWSWSEVAPWATKAVGAGAADAASARFIAALNHPLRVRAALPDES
jgi:predicted DNA-binding transcriptional regulator AlpA